MNARNTKATPQAQADAILARIEQAQQDGRTVGQPFDGQILDIKWQRASAQVANLVSIGNDIAALAALIGLTGKALTGNAVYDAVAKASDVDGASVIARGVARAKATLKSGPTATRALQTAQAHTPERFDAYRAAHAEMPNAETYRAWLMFAFGPTETKGRPQTRYTFTGKGLATIIKRVATPAGDTPAGDTPASGKVSQTIGIGDLLTGNAESWSAALTAEGAADISMFSDTKVRDLVRVFVARALLIAAETPAAPEDADAAALAALAAE